MSATTNQRPKNKMPWLVPNLTVKDVDAACNFYVNALGFRKKGSTEGNDQTTWHAELLYQDHVIILSKEAIPGKMSKTPNNLGSASPMNLYLYCDDVDETFKRAVTHGAIIRTEPANTPWNDRIAIVADPDGYYWVIATCDVTTNKPH